MLGAADIAARAVMPAIATSSNGRLVALASRSPQRARNMISNYRDARICDSYEALLEETDVDAVYIPLVNSLHREWSLRAVAAGKHVLCEKPLALNAAEAEEMAAAADREGRLLMEAFMYRFAPRMNAFVDSIRDPLHVEARFGFLLRDPGNYRFDAALGGGALLDVGCYVVGAARWMLGDPIEVLARARMQHGIDMTVSALLVFDEGRTASVWASFESPEEQELTVISGDQVHRVSRPFTPPENREEAYRLMVESFAESLLHDRPPTIPVSDSIANMRVLDRIRASFSS